MVGRATRFRGSRTAVAALVAAAALASPAVAPAHVLSEASAYGVADRLGEHAFSASAWADTWGDECNRQTPWRFSCFDEVWREPWTTAGDCWRYFDVVSAIVGSRLHLEHVEGWQCDPYPK
jgi:hypothetical protein